MAFNIRKSVGPAGGGFAFAEALEAALRARGHDVHRELAPNLDAILIVSFRYHPGTTTFGLGDIEEYLFANPNTAVVLRVNDSDEARGRELGIHQAVEKAHVLADSTVFVSTFIRELHRSRGLSDGKPLAVVPNAADPTIFHPRDHSRWKPGQPFRLVTHHWSGSFMKGFDIYERLDLMLDEPGFRDRFEFVYVGRLPLGFSLRNATVLPLSPPREVAEILRGCHGYLTGARLEAAPMHAIEALQCGLPVLHIRSGSLAEYCGAYGIGFTPADFEAKLEELLDRYEFLAEEVANRPDGFETMTIGYLETIEAAVSNRMRRMRPKPGLVSRSLHACRRSLAKGRTLTRRILNKITVF